MAYYLLQRILLRKMCVMTLHFKVRYQYIVSILYMNHNFIIGTPINTCAKNEA